MSASEAPRPKKSVALSGVTAGNTALCSVGQTGNDLHYRGYDILEVADSCDFEEIAYLLIHGKLPNQAQLTAYKAQLRNLRGLPAPVRAVLEQLPAAAHPMDVLRTGASVMGCILPEKEDHDPAGAREIADHLLACFPSMLCYWHHFSHNGQKIHVETDDDTIAGHFLHLLHRKSPPGSWVRAMHTSLNLYAEHEFNSSTFTARVIAGTGSDIYSCIAGAIGALRGPKHGGANEVALQIQERYDSADEAEADIRRRVANKEIVIGFGHPVYTVSDPRNVVIKRVAEKLAREAGDLKLYQIAERIESLMWNLKKMFPNLDCRQLPPHGCAHGHVHAAVRHVARHRVERACHRAARGRQDHPSGGKLHGSREPQARAAVSTGLIFTDARLPGGRHEFLAHGLGAAGCLRRIGRQYLDHAA
jgi:2-methylcitrate synthase